VNRTHQRRIRIVLLSLQIRELERERERERDAVAASSGCSLMRENDEVHLLALHGLSLAGVLSAQKLNKANN
jgi:hypothetical protein